MVSKVSLRNRKDNSSSSSREPRGFFREGSIPNQQAYQLTVEVRTSIRTTTYVLLLVALEGCQRQAHQPHVISFSRFSFLSETLGRYVVDPALPKKAEHSMF